MFFCQFFPWITGIFKLLHVADTLEEIFVRGISQQFINEYLKTSCNVMCDWLVGILI
jgi:hypothetical protein